MTPTRVFLVAPSPIARAGLRSMLAAVGDPGVRVVGEATALAGTGSEPSLSEADVVLVSEENLLEEGDVTLSDDGAQALLVLSEDEGTVPRLRSLSPRGWGVVPPDAPPEELGVAVAAAAQGLVVLPRALTERLLGTPVPVEEPSEPLTPRESEVLGLLGDGLSNKMIARELHISEHTVKFHVSSLYAKLGVASRVEAVSQGARRGLISL